MNLATMNDFTSGISVQSITFSGNGYTLSGFQLPLNGGGITLDSMVTTGTTTISLPIFLGAPQTWTVTNASAILQVDGAISGGSPTGLTVAGAGTVILTGVNTYLGPTTVSGSLLVNGSQPNSNVTVVAGATLGGSGTVGTITTSGIISPGGPGPGTLHSSNATFNAGSSLVIGITGSTAGTGYSQLSVMGPVDLSGNPTLTVALGNFAPAVGTTFMPLTFTSVLIGTFNGLPDNSTLTVSNRNFRVNYQGSDLLLTLVSVNSQTVVTSSANPAVFGQPVTFTATVTSATRPAPAPPTGTVTFLDGTNTLGTASLNTSGVATFSPTTPLSVGTHTITAMYSGDSNFAASTSIALMQTVNMAATTTTLASSANPAVFGQSVTFTASVTPTAPGAGTPTGTVTFEEGTNTLGTASLSASGTATFSPTTLAVGTHSITAVYSGDSNFATSTSTALAQIINPAGTATVRLAPSVNPSVFGQSISFTATITPNSGFQGPPPAPTGTVQFQIDGANFGGPVTLNNGVAASGSISTLSVGSHTITAIYSGDSNFSMSTAVLTQTVNRANTLTTLVPPSASSGAGLPLTFTAMVQALPPGAGTPTGTVTFQDGTTTLGTASLGSTGSASFTTVALSAGNHSITAVYNGDSNFSLSTSPPAMVTISSNNNPFNAFVAALYAKVLGRSPDAAGLTFWVQQLQAGATRASVALAFETSGERALLIVQSFYHNLLNRAAEQPGLNFWVHALVSGISEADVAVGFLASAEYTAKRGPDNTTYVTSLYQDLFHRTPSPAEAAPWVNALQQNLQSRTQVALSFLSSTESLMIAVNSYFTDLLDRTPQASEVQGYLAALQSGQFTPIAITTVFLSSEEFFTRAPMLAQHPVQLF
jgi:autotransporter-associated beta strand protein